MPRLTEKDVRSYLRKSIPSLNQNKIFGIHAEADFRKYVASLGASDRISPGGWIFRKKGPVGFGTKAIAVFPHSVRLHEDYSQAPDKTSIPLPLHTICATMHQIGIESYYAHPVRLKKGDMQLLGWKFIQLGVPWDTAFTDLDVVFSDFRKRERNYQYLRHKTDVSGLSLPDALVQFSHDNLRIFVETAYMAEVSDIDGIIWGERFTYPIEVKEKVAASDKDIGDWFGLDTGPFVKLAHYAANRGNLNSLFVVREIEDQETRKLRQWLFIRFEELAKFASWVPRAGGQSMGGGRSMVVRVPRAAFSVLNAKSLSSI